MQRPLASRPRGWPLLLALLAPAPARAAFQDACVWEPRSDAPVPRFEPAVLEVDGRILLFGGFSAFPGVTARVDRYDPATDAWTRLRDMPAPLTHAAPARDGRQVWFAGGFLGAHPGPVTDLVWIYDLDGDTWHSGPRLPRRVGAGALVRVGRSLHYFGGVGADRDTDSADHWALDLDSPGAWVPRAPFPDPRNHFSAAEVGGLIYALGGQNRHDTNPFEVALVHVYDPLADAWSARAPMPVPRSHAEPGTFVEGGEIVMTGGRSAPLDKPTLPDSSAYDPTTDTWRALPSLPLPLLAPAVRRVGGLVVATSGATTGLVSTTATFVRDVGAGATDASPTNLGGGAFAPPDTTRPFCPDFGFEEALAFTNPFTGDIGATLDDPVYQSERYAPAAHPERLAGRIPATDGLYRVRLHFAEIFWGAPGGAPGGPGSRVFDVYLEDELVLDDYDILDAVGAVTADVHTFDVAVAGLALDVRLEATADRPKISALEWSRLPDDGWRSFCTSTASSTGAPATIGFVGTTSVAENVFTLIARPVPDQPGVHYYGLDEVRVPFGNGFRCVGGRVFRLPVTLAAGNALRTTIDLARPPVAAARILPGATWKFQAWFRDPDAGGAMFDLSDGLSVTFTL